MTDALSSFFSSYSLATTVQVCILSVSQDRICVLTLCSALARPPRRGRLLQLQRSLLDYQDSCEHAPDPRTWPTDVFSSSFDALGEPLGRMRMDAGKAAAGSLRVGA